MGSLVQHTASLRVLLESEHLVGRGERCQLRIDDPRVSQEHASLRWDGEAWLVRDLGSTNQTFLDGRALLHGETEALALGARIAFGAQDQAWLLDSIDPPCVMAVPTSAGQDSVLELSGLLALPSAANPEVTLFRTSEGSWEVEPASALARVRDQALITVADRQYRLCIPRTLARTVPVRGLQGSRVADLAISFLVSRDQEHIELLVRSGPLEQRLPARSHNELLRLLAMARRRDAENGLPAPHCGWLYQEQLFEMAKIEPEHLNVHVFRIRQQFAEMGLVDPAQIVERRVRTRQLRFGVHQSVEHSE